MKTLKENLLRNVGVGRTRLIEQWVEENLGLLPDQYRINKDFTIDVDGYVIIDDNDMVELPDYIQFGKVKYDFRLWCPNLTTLRGCPEEVGKDFSCNETKIKALDGAPKKAHRFFCAMCKNLTSLHGSPEEVSTFSCVGCPKIRDLKGCPKKAEYFSCYGCGKEFTVEEVREHCALPVIYNVGNDDTHIQVKKPGWVRR